MPILVIYITATMLFIGAAPLPYGYYILLRLVATGVFVWAAVIAYERKRLFLPWIYVLIALIFNPFIKIYLTKEVWIFVDIISAVILFSTKSKIISLKS